METENIRDYVLEEANKGNVVVNTECGLVTYKLSEIVKIINE